jgi:GNAT superfamily N-acetyltransferase
MRRFTVDDFEQAYVLSQSLGWPHRAGDWRFIEQFGGGWVAQYGSKVIGTALWSTYGATHGAIGLVIVVEALQGKGIGRKLMTSAMECLEGRVIGLHATPVGKPLYEKLGFAATGIVAQHQSNHFSVPDIVLSTGDRLRHVDAFNPAERETVMRMVSDAVGYNRSRLTDALLRVGEAIVFEREGQIAGCAFRRSYGRGYGIAPVIAPDIAIAQAMYAYWLSQSAGHFIRTDIDINSDLGQWLQSLGLDEVSRVVRMRYGPGFTQAPVEPQKAMIEFAIVNQALG